MSSVTFDKIVPLGQYFVLDDMPLALALKERVTFFLCLIYVSVDSCKYSEPRLGSRHCGHVSGFLDGVEYSPAPNSGYLREEPVLYGVPLGAVRRIVGDSDVNAHFLRSFHKFPLEQPASGIVGATPVTKDADALCTWIYVAKMLLPLFYNTVAGKLGSVVAHTESHVPCIPAHIVYTMRHHLAVGKCGIVMVVDLYWLCAVGRTVVTSERAKEFLLLRVHTNDGDAILCTFLPNPLYVPELFIAQLAVCHRQGLYGLAPGVPLDRHDLPDSIEAYLYMVLLIEYGLDLRRSQPEPLRVGILRESCDIKFYYLAEDGDILGMLGERALPTSSLFADSALFEVLACLKLMTASVDGVTGYVEDAADKAGTMPAIPFCYDSGELSRQSLVCAPEVFHFLVCYYICWIIRDLHNCLEFSCKGTNFLAGLRI